MDHADAASSHNCLTDLAGYSASSADTTSRRGAGKRHAARITSVTASVRRGCGQPQATMTENCRRPDPDIRTANIENCIAGLNRPRPVRPVVCEPLRAGPFNLPGSYAFFTCSFRCRSHLRGIRAAGVIADAIRVSGMPPLVTTSVFLAEPVCLTSKNRRQTPIPMSSAMNKRRRSAMTTPERVTRYDARSTAKNHSPTG